MICCVKGFSQNDFFVTAAISILFQQSGATETLKLAPVRYKAASQHKITLTVSITSFREFNQLSDDKTENLASKKSR